MGLAKDVLGMEFERFLGTGLNAERITLTQVALERMFNVLVEKHGAEGTTCQTLVAGDALLLVETYNPVLLIDGVGGTSFAALWHAALPADDGHTDNRVWIKHHDPHAALFRVVHIFPSNAAGQFADFATGASLWNNCKMHRLPPI